MKFIIFVSLFQVVFCPCVETENDLFLIYRATFQSNAYNKIERKKGPMFKHMIRFGTRNETRKAVLCCIVAHSIYFEFARFSHSCVELVVPTNERVRDAYNVRTVDMRLRPYSFPFYSEIKCHKFQWIFKFNKVLLNEMSITFCVRCVFLDVAPFLSRFLFLSCIFRVQRFFSLPQNVRIALMLLK